MSSFLPVLLRTVVVFAIFCGLQYLIPWHLLAIGGVVAGIFMLKTSDDRPMSLGVLIGSIAFAIFAYTMGHMYPG